MCGMENQVKTRDGTLVFTHFYLRENVGDSGAMWQNQVTLILLLHIFAIFFPLWKNVGKGSYMVLHVL